MSQRQLVRVRSKAPFADQPESMTCVERAAAPVMDSASPGLNEPLVAVQVNEIRNTFALRADTQRGDGRLQRHLSISCHRPELSLSVCAAQRIRCGPECRQHGNKQRQRERRRCRRILGALLCSQSKILRLLDCPSRTTSDGQEMQNVALLNVAMALSAITS